MSKAFSLYPVLTSNLIEKAGIETEPTEISYLDDGDYYPLSMEDKEGDEQKFSARLSDVRCVWSADTHNLILKKAGSIQHPDLLFGKDGIVPHDAIIGIAGIWSSKRSDLHGSIQYGKFGMRVNAYNFDQEYRFESGELRGSIHFKLVLYLKEAGQPYADEMHLANQTGIILGVIEEFDLIIDGSGSVFPIYYVNEPDRPLWWVSFSSTDPMEDAFDDQNVVLYLNQAHPSYGELKINDSLRESPLFLEVISSALYIIVQSVKELVDEEWDVIEAGEDLEQGTIAEAISYFINKLGWDTSSPVKLALSIHDYFDKNLR